MAVQISRNIPDALHAKVVAEWGSEALWWQWVKDRSRQHLQNVELRAAEMAANAALEVERQRILNDETTL